MGKIGRVGEMEIENEVITTLFIFYMHYFIFIVF